MIRPNLLCLISLLPICTNAGESVSPGKSLPPNIIVMMADDMGMGDTSAYQDVTGNGDDQQIHTPAMERLARMGVRLTDAHTPASRCSPTRYGLLTGRYPWRNRLKFWVLFGSQGDPMIERDRPTIASFLKDQGYRTGMVGKWHVGLRFRKNDGRPAAAFADADLQQPLHDCPLDHGFEFAKYTSRSHGTSGPQPGRRNRPDQNIGPGHLDGRVVVGATANGRQLAGDGDYAYVLNQLGGRHSDNAMQFLQSHVTNPDRQNEPFFLYYASNSNHTPYTPDDDIDGHPVSGAACSVSGRALNRRADFVYENDVALGRLLDWLQSTEDPRRPGQKLIANTLVVFTSDNGAEIDSDVATGPYRSHKGSCFEGGHRVPFLVAWPDGNIGDGNGNTPGRTSRQLLGLTDLFATLADILNQPLPAPDVGQKGAEDSLSMLAALTSNETFDRPLFFNDHKQAADPAVVVLRMDNPIVDGAPVAGQWKIFFDHQLIRFGNAQPTALYDLATDPGEQNNRMSETSLRPLVNHLTRLAADHRNAGGHRLTSLTRGPTVRFRWATPNRLSDRNQGESVVVDIDSRIASGTEHFHVEAGNCRLTVRASTSGASFNVNSRGLGIDGGQFGQVDAGEAVLLSFDCDVIVESVAVVAGNGVCGGFYKVGEHAPLAIYCIDDDIDSKDQSGRLSDPGVLKAGQTLRLDSSPHLGVETPGRWRLADLTVRPLQANRTPNRPGR